MTASIALGRRSATQHLLRRLPPASVVVSVLLSTAFCLVQPAVGDLWAARARESAAANGVGLTYWFSWYSGGSAPGNYSVLAPYLSALFGAVVIGSVSTVSTTVLCARLLRGHPAATAATWTVTVAAALSLWSGRIPFAVGTAVTVAALIAVRDKRFGWAAVLAAVCALVSPVSAVFLVLCLGGAVLTTAPYRRISLVASGAALVTLAGEAVVFGMPGPEHFEFLQAGLTMLELAAFLLARPPRFLAIPILAAIALCPLLVVVPNGMGSNVMRLAWTILPAAVVATARSRRSVALLAVSFAVLAGANTTVGSLGVAFRPASALSYYTPLVRRLDGIHHLDAYRVEVVADGTHTAAYALLGHATLARGYETQSENGLNSVLTAHPVLTAQAYRTWLDDNAVGYVALGTADTGTNPEHDLVARRTPAYLRPVWHDATWTLYRVAGAPAVAAAPATVTDDDQATMTVSVPCACTVTIRVHWSRFLAVAGGDGPPATLARTGQGWSALTTRAGGTYVLRGSDLP